MKWLIDKEIKGFNAQLDVEITAILGGVNENFKHQ